MHGMRTNSATDRIGPSTNPSRKNNAGGTTATMEAARGAAKIAATPRRESVKPFTDSQTPTGLDTIGVAAATRTIAIAA